jgi:hypothetical protein
MNLFRLSMAALLATSFSAQAQDPSTCAPGTPLVTCVVNEGGKGKKCECKQLMQPGSNGEYKVRQVEFRLPKFGHNCQANVTIVNESDAKQRFVQQSIRFNDLEGGIETQVTVVAVHHMEKPQRDDKVYCTLTMHIDQ